MEKNPIKTMTEDFTGNSIPSNQWTAGSERFWKEFFFNQTSKPSMPFQEGSPFVFNP